MKYRVKDNPTLEGEPAGPDMGNFLLFEPGDLVEIVGARVVDAVRLSDDLDQCIDFDSLEPFSE